LLYMAARNHARVLQLSWAVVDTLEFLWRIRL
jgi:hypothetical protein